MIMVSLAEWQAQCASEVEALSDDEAKDAYGALVSIVHQMSRQEAGLGMPVALDEIEVFARSFEAYVEQLDELTPEKLETTTKLCGVVSSNMVPHPICAQAPALMVIILDEMIRRRGMNENKHDMSGYDRALRMLNRLERQLDPK